MKNIILQLLSFFSKKILQKYNPKVIGITGSVGKTSTKEAIFKVVSKNHSVRENIKNYNNEFGMPLTIIGCVSPGRNIVGWIGVFIKAIKLLVFKMPYPEMLVLEMGADRPGDIGYLTDVAPVTIGVLTEIAEAHLKEFKTIEAVQKEKQKIVTKIKKGSAIINIDNPLCKEVIEKVSVKTLTYGIEQEADIKALEVNVAGFDKEFCNTQEEWDCATWGMSFKVQAFGSTVPFFIPRAIGIGYVYAALAATAVGLEMGMNLVTISEALQSYTAPTGRMNVIAGIKGSLIIDDTYNAQPTAVLAALEIISTITPLQNGRRIAILGDMLELEDMSDEMHAKVGQEVARLGYDVLVCVGELGAQIGKAAIKAGMDASQVKYFETSTGTGNALQETIQPQDIILVKGSQGARMERVVKELMAQPLLADKLLVRQSKEWQ